MSINNSYELTKENALQYLKEVAREYKKLNRKGTPAEIIIVGGGSILLNYSFRLATTDLDAFTIAASSLKQAINKVTDKYGLPNGWINSDFVHTSSYTDKLIQYSEYFKTFYNVFTIRTVSREYLIAMKIKSARLYRNDLSDILGILSEQIEMNDPISFEEIKTAYIRLYDHWDDVDPEIMLFLQSVYTSNDIKALYAETRKKELNTKTMLIEFDKENPKKVTTSNVNEILDLIKRQK